MRSRRSRLVMIALVTCALGVSARVEAADLVWRPALSVGRYWVVRSERTLPVHSPGEGKYMGEEPAGFYFTRFRVTALERFAGGARVTLEVRNKVDPASSFEDDLDSYEMVIRLPQWRVVSATWRGEDGRGEPFSNVSKGNVDATYPHPYCWPFRIYFPPKLVIVLPVFQASEDGTGARLQSLSGTGWPEFQQVVVPSEDGSFDVTIENADCPQIVPKLRFTPTGQWYQVIGADGSVLNPVVEVGGG